MSTPVAGPLAVPPRPAIDPRAGAAGEAIRATLEARGADATLAAFYADRRERPLWIVHRRLRPEAREVVRLARGAAADGLDPADYGPEALDAVVRAAASGRAADLARAEIALSRTLAAYAADLRRSKPAAQLLYSDHDLPPPRADRRAALDTLAQAPSLEAGIAAATRMNPFYLRLREALAEDAARGGAHHVLLRLNLERARALPVDLGRRYILVDVTAQRLWIYEDGRPVDNMKVVVGKPGEPTPAMAALVRYAVFRPYWNVPPDLVAASVAPKVLKEGVGYVRNQRLEALSDWSDQARPLDPSTVNWRAVAQGRQELRVRQLPGPGNMMGRVKFMFPNELGVYLHDSPLRALFTGDERLGSAGCVRLEDADRLARWLLDDKAVAAGEAPGQPETRVSLARPVPVYIVYFTAAPAQHGISLRKDVYGRDGALIAALAPEAGGASRLASR